MTYKYPIKAGGYRWNAERRILLEVGIAPAAIGDIQGETWVQFERDLTAAEKTKLDTLMAGNPQLPPASTVVLKISDIWENFAAFKTACNLPNLQLFYSESVPGSGKVDQIELHHPTTLTNTQKTTIKTQYTNLFKG